MEFAWNTQKNKMSDIKGLEKEQNREGKISNEEIDLNKTHLNYDLVQSNLNLYQRVKQRVDEVRPVSRIQKNSVVDYSNIITVPKEQFKEWGLDKSREYLKEVYNYFCNEFGKENVVSAKVHLDESTPHMHLHFVPVSKEGKLQARKVVTPQRINKIHTDAPKYLQEKGFEVVRGKGKTEKSLEIHEFKAEKLKENINELENTLNGLKNDLEKILTLDDVKLEKVKLPLMKGKIIVSKAQYDKNVSLAKLGIVTARENKSLKKEIEQKVFEIKNIQDKIFESNNKAIDKLKSEIEQLKSENLYYSSKAENLNSKLGKFYRENKTLKNNQKALVKTVSSLDIETQKFFTNELKKNIKSIKRSLTQDLER